MWLVIQYKVTQNTAAIVNLHHETIASINQRLSEVEYNIAQQLKDPSSPKPDGLEDSLFDDAVAFVRESNRASISSLQRELGLGYNRSARMIEAMESEGIVSKMSTNGARKVL
jgi:DNA segregation ATPase FtsK/SpoIIIE-like protein